MANVLESFATSAERINDCVKEVISDLESSRFAKEYGSSTVTQIKMVLRLLGNYIFDREITAYMLEGANRWEERSIAQTHKIKHHLYNAALYNAAFEIEKALTERETSVCAGKGGLLERNLYKVMDIIRTTSPQEVKFQQMWAICKAALENE